MSIISKCRPYRPRQTSLRTAWFSPGASAYAGGPKVLRELPALLECRFVHGAGWRDTRGNPISLPKVSILERYDEKGNPL